MQRAAHLGWHTFRGQRNDHSRKWISYFDRAERHRMIEEDRTARNHVLGVLSLAMGAGLVILITALTCFVR